MKNSFKRNRIHDIVWIIIGLLIIFGIINEKSIVIIYDGFFLLCAIFTIVNGVWGLVTPIVRINKFMVEIRLSIFTSKTFDLEKIQEIGYDKNKQILKLDSFRFRLIWMNSDCRTDFINELKKLRKQINDQ